MPDQTLIPGKRLKQNETSSPRGLAEPPMMYRAQVQGRCNLQFAGDRGDNPDRTQWMQEWLLSGGNLTSPKYQYDYESTGDKTKASIYTFTVKFPHRVFSNSGQDSIARPVFSNYGIPYIPGSSIKGLLKRLLYSDETLPQSDRQLVETYCGDEENPGILRGYLESIN